ncbi:Uncharacterised protein [Myroides odoratimimus]|uniref:Outer membrane protein beta-barrel domain-containing protein n=1 Tax=Myroides odoratimimus CCUG 10230 TaxID=883150 RepID=A0ABP2NGF9_9FLAO|nr:hypothetical protein HMPREF9712_00101 [Myroides odoratimimus CCUG 10230]STZ47803.1 Uncharacterised protein [Myroides odoratimimus]
MVNLSYQKTNGLKNNTLYKKNDYQIDSRFFIYFSFQT